MKKKLKELITAPGTTRRLGDFICNFVAVVLGIVITFAGSDIIEERNKQKEVAQALQLIKEELLINREDIKDMMEIETFEQRGALYLLHHKDKMDEAPEDSLNKYCCFPFQSAGFIYTTDAMEMLRASSLMPNIKNKELATQIIKTYTIIKGAYQTFSAYTESKVNTIDKLCNRPDYLEFSNKQTTQEKRWSFILSLPEGLSAIQQISVIHDNPQRIYSRYMDFIDETISVIDKEYK